ncbi:MAG: hypothetical protein K2P87_07115 [Lachnospiraceae bacterium]|nr:hypothetical protein [Lachnospiraceae bacterium]
MANTEEIRKTITAPENEEVAILLESLDENSKVLAKTYMSALADRQRLEKSKAAAAALAAV